MVYESGVLKEIRRLLNVSSTLVSGYSEAENTYLKLLWPLSSLDRPQAFLSWVRNNVPRRRKPGDEGRLNLLSLCDQKLFNTLMLFFISDSSHGCAGMERCFLRFNGVMLSRSFGEDHTLECLHVKNILLPLFKHSNLLIKSLRPCQCKINK